MTEVCPWKQTSVLSVMTSKQQKQNDGNTAESVFEYGNLISCIILAVFPRQKMKNFSLKKGNCQRDNSKRGSEPKQMMDLRSCDDDFQKPKQAAQTGKPRAFCDV